MASKPILPCALKTRLQVAAIDFGTTYSGYALSFRAEYETDPLKIFTYEWRSSKTKTIFPKTPSCILFRPDQTVDSFGFEAEDKYAELAADEKHFDWFYFKHFKMALYNTKLSRTTKLTDVEGKQMPALKVFSEMIRLLKEHLINHYKDRKHGLNADEIHWVLTVPAIWDDTAKLFMREAGIDAGIAMGNLSLALEPEAASLFCRQLPVQKITGDDGVTVSCFSPGTQYIVVDAGGGTVDITVHETQPDHTVRELYKANGGPWGGTKIDEAYIHLLEGIVGRDVMERFIKNHRDDYLDLVREFEARKTSFGPDIEATNGKITIRIPVSIHETYNQVTGQDFRRSLMMRHDLKDNVTFMADKIRVRPQEIKQLFTETCDKIVTHVNDVFKQPNVRDVGIILMVGGFSESKMLQDSIRKAFPDKIVIIPEEAGLAVVKGAVLFGHNPNTIATRVSKRTYGQETHMEFKPGIHPESRKVIIEGAQKCRDCFSKHIEIDQEVKVGRRFDAQSYWPLWSNQTKMTIKVFTSDKKDPKYSDDPGCEFLGKLTVDISGLPKEEQEVSVQMVYGGTHLDVETTVVKTGKHLASKIDCLG